MRITYLFLLLISWDKDNWISDVQEDHSIAYQKEAQMQQETFKQHSSIPKK